MTRPRIVDPGATLALSRRTTRRHFLVGTAGALAHLSLAQTTTAESTQHSTRRDDSFPLKAISSANGLRATGRAYQLLRRGIDPLDAVIDLEKALDSEAPRIHDQLESNLSAHVIQEKGNYDSIKKKADVVIERRFFYDHGLAAAMENRGIVADWDEKNQQLKVWDTTQAPIPIRNGLAAMLGLSESQVHVIAPFIGGGFGPKIMMFYPEEVLIPWVAMQLMRPVKWIEDRQENFFATTHERGQIHDAELAVTKDGKILGVRDVFLHDAGGDSRTLPSA